MPKTSVEQWQKDCYYYGFIAVKKDKKIKSCNHCYFVFCPKYKDTHEK